MERYMQIWEEQPRQDENLTVCKVCGKQISKNAEACPHCGEPLPKKKPPSKWKGVLYIVAIFYGITFILWVTESGYYSDKNHAKRQQHNKRDEAVKAEAEAVCKQDLQCWGDKNNIVATVYCKDYIEKLAKYSHKWTDGMLEPKFSRFRWKDKSKGSVTYVGDKIKFQNGFGAWQNYTYECDIEPQTKKVIDVRAAPGRL
jgi:RNA polymerase subunit RPABC4/transcription elongation factor Spt4